MTWIAPDNGGSPITHYTIYFRAVDGTTFFTQLDFCDGTNPIIRDSTSCVVPSIILHETVFNLPWSSHIYCKVVATNIYGDSLESIEGDGAVILAVPDAPVNLNEDYSKRYATLDIGQLGLTWQDGADPGGIPVLDYRITIKQADIVFEQLVLGVTTKYYTATNLQAGLNYDF